MKEEYKDFIGIYDESVPVELCNVFVENWEEAKKNRTMIDLSGEENVSRNPVARKDEAAFVYPTSSTILPRPPVEQYFEFLRECFECYIKRYSILFAGPIYNDVFKIHKVRKSEGYHIWHYEKSSAEFLDRMMAYMTYLEVPKKGGETEFLHQSLRIDPVVGRTLIWPTGFTHMHRGLMPLDGEKMYITGWFNTGREDYKDVVGK